MKNEIYDAKYKKHKIRILTILILLILFLNCVLSLLVYAKSNQGLNSPVDIYYEAPVDCLVYRDLPDGTLAVTGLKTGLKEYPQKLVIPDMYNGKKVTQILRSFYWMGKYLEIRCENVIIEQDSFSRNDHLLSIIFYEKATPYVDDSDEPFYECRSLLEVVSYNSSTNVSSRNWGFVDNPPRHYYTDKSHLQTINGMIYFIDGDEFILCGPKNKNITSVDINENTNEIAYGAFEDCSALTSVTIPSGVKNMMGDEFNRGDEFNNCSSLTDVTIDSQYVYERLNYSTSMGHLVYYANTVKVLKSIDNGKANYLNNYFLKDSTSDETYNIYTKK